MYLRVECGETVIRRVLAREFQGGAADTANGSGEKLEKRPTALDGGSLIGWHLPTLAQKIAAADNSFSYVLGESAMSSGATRRSTPITARGRS